MPKDPPSLGFGLVKGALPEPDQLVVKLDPATGVRFVFDAPRAGSPGPEATTLDMEFAMEGGEGATPYEVLLQPAMTGRSTRFPRQDAVDEEWRIVQPLLDAPPPVHTYAQRSRGPAVPTNWWPATAGTCRGRPRNGRARRLTESVHLAAILSDDGTSHPLVRDATGEELRDFGGDQRGAHRRREYRTPARGDPREAPQRAHCCHRRTHRGAD
jgi:hypothetical protein